MDKPEVNGYTPPSSQIHQTIGKLSAVLADVVRPLDVVLHHRIPHLVRTHSARHGLEAGRLGELTRIGGPQDCGAGRSHAGHKNLLPLRVRRKTLETLKTY